MFRKRQYRMQTRRVMPGRTAYCPRHAVKVRGGAFIRDEKRNKQRAARTRRGRTGAAKRPQRRRACILATQRSANQLSTGKMLANQMSTTCAPAPVDTLSLSTAVHTRQEAVSKKCAEVIAMISGLVRNVRTRNFLPGAKDALRKTARRTLNKNFAPEVMFEHAAGLYESVCSYGVADRHRIRYQYT